MSSRIHLIAGLANPGEKYADTRHNAGAWFVEQIVAEANISLRREAKFHGRHALTHLHGQSCHLLIPSTFMNLSGQAVGACMNYAKLEPENVLVAHDEVDLPVGVVRLKFDGGDGGHNGVKDVIHHLHTKKFYRLRIGIGRPTHGEVVDYVLEKPSKTDRKIINTALEAVYAILPLIIEGDMQKAMHQLHSQPQ